jgi:hypothetical protein
MSWSGGRNVMRKPNGRVVLEVLGIVATIVAAFLGGALYIGSVSHIEGTSGVVSGPGAGPANINHGGRQQSNNRGSQNNGRQNNTRGPQNNGQGTQNNSAGPLNNGQQNNAAGPLNNGQQNNAAGPQKNGEGTQNNIRGGNNGSGTQNNGSGTQNVYPPARPTPPSWGEAKITRVTPNDGSTSMGTSARIELDITKQPTNGNRLFLVCELLGQGPGGHDLYFAKAEILGRGHQSFSLRFGGGPPADPKVVGTTRICSVVTADGTAAQTLSFLMSMDQKGIKFTPEGENYDLQRLQLPIGSFTISNSVAITVQHV